MKSFTEGSIVRHLGRFALPIVATSLLQVAIQLINGLWVGNLLGSAAFGAVTVGTILMMVVLAFVMGVNQATLTIFAQLRGRNDARAIRAYLSAFVIILVLLSAFIGWAGYAFADELLKLLNTPPAIIDEARIYLQITFAGTLLLVGYNFISTVLRAFGDSRTPLYFVLLATVLITLLSPLFIGGWGMTGAALAFVAAHRCAAVCQSPGTRVHLILDGVREKSFSKYGHVLLLVTFKRLRWAPSVFVRKPSNGQRGIQSTMSWYQTRAH